MHPSAEIEKNYEAALATEMAVIAALKPGITFAEVFAAGLQALQETAPDLVEKLYKRDLGLVAVF